MQRKFVLTFLECLSFILWMGFTIFSIAMAGIGIEGILFAAFMEIGSATHHYPVPISMTFGGVVGVLLSLLWRQVGVDHFHYLSYDSPRLMGDDDDEPAHVLRDLIREVESCDGYARNDARTKAKTWLLGHETTLDAEDLILARAHFGYLLPAQWGLTRATS